jgi:hypothetical protein
MGAGDDDEAGEESNGVEFVTSERVKVAAMLASLSFNHGGSSEFGREANFGRDSDKLIGGNEEERKGSPQCGWLVVRWSEHDRRRVVANGGPLVTLNSLPGTPNGTR